MDASPWNPHRISIGVAERRQELADENVLPSLRDSASCLPGTPDWHPGLRPVVPPELLR